MREFEYIFDQGLLKGLRKTTQSRLRGQTLVEAYNMTAKDGALGPYEELTLPDEWKHIPIFDNWPFIVQGTRHNYMLSFQTTGVAIYDIGSDLTLSGINASAVSDAGFISYCDFGEVTIITGIEYSVVIDKVAGIVTYFSDTLQVNYEFPTLPRLTDCCNFRGQLVGGNPIPDWYGCVKNSIVYSDIGSLNMIPTRQNTAGNIFLDTEHTIKRVLPLLDHVIVYTSGDIFALTPVSSPAVTFKPTRLGPVGIMNPYALAGDTSSHVMIDYSGQMWRIDNTLKLVKLGYSEFFKDKDNSLKISHDKLANEWRIRTDTDSYLLTGNELTSTFQKVYAVYNDETYRAGVVKEASDKSAVIVTDATDFGYRGIKTIHGVEIATNSIADVSVAIDYRFKSNEEFTRGPWIRLNDLGQMGKPQAGNEFRLCVKFSHYSQANIDYIKARYKMSDMRGLRGVYSPPPRGQYVS